MLTGTWWDLSDGIVSTAQSELFNGSWGLLKSSGSSYNTADAEANQEMVVTLRMNIERKCRENWISTEY